MHNQVEKGTIMKNQKADRNEKVLNKQLCAFMTQVDN